MCANFAYRTLTYQGFTRDTIHYMTSDTDIDLDGNGEPDDVDSIPGIASLEYAITQWTLQEPKVDSLLLYITDHGDEGTFRLNENEILSVSDLDTWLDQVQEHITGKVYIIYDACHSGSFLKLDPPENRKRIIITSASSEENAYFISQGAIPFSNFFWTHIFNGKDIREPMAWLPMPYKNFRHPCWMPTATELAMKKKTSPQNKL
ncbi:MAG: hypothetical protein GY795_10045 [Desulfobacterales bacterium]|nr:hypothetical protein [Desulfobacterales bacterium]